MRGPSDFDAGLLAGLVGLAGVAGVAGLAGVVAFLAGEAGVVVFAAVGAGADVVEGEEAAAVALVVGVGVVDAGDVADVDGGVSSSF